VEQLQQQLLAWADAGSGVTAVLLDSDNDRSFCSGAVFAACTAQHVLQSTAHSFEEDRPKVTPTLRHSAWQSQPLHCLVCYKHPLVNRAHSCAAASSCDLYTWCVSLFCRAGGDVKAARQAVLDSPYADFPPESHHIHRVFTAEYSTLLLIASYKLPFVSCCQGIWMGLGFGLAGFGRYRVVSDGTIFAMPENAIGGLAVCHQPSAWCISMHESRPCVQHECTTASPCAAMHTACADHTNTKGAAHHGLNRSVPYSTNSSALPSCQSVKQSHVSYRTFVPIHAASSQHRSLSAVVHVQGSGLMLALHSRLPTCLGTWACSLA
jgi:enoyl-CoA hydratase/carnithine racemase